MIKLNINIKNNNITVKPHNSHLPALTGVRFFAIFHIFLHHLWAIYTYHSGKTDETQGLLIGLKDAPDFLMVFMSNGWVSTSLFFLLSGFILAHLYWGKNNQLSIAKSKFWALRFVRLYPIHLVVLLILIVLKLPDYLNDNAPLEWLVPSAVANALLLQAWLPDFIPMWSWPTWTISVMIFLYLLMPFLIKLLSRLSHKQQILTLLAMPFVSIVPSCIYAYMLFSGVPWSMSMEIFFANFPLFWVPYFVAGLLMSKVFSLNKSHPIANRVSVIKKFAWGDLAFLVVIIICFIPNIEQPWLFFIKQGLLMPLYIVFLRDLARGRGLMARVFSVPSLTIMGETGFAIFIWQSVVMTAAFISLIYFPEIGPYQVWLCIVLVIAISIPSTYLFEKPLAKFLRKRYIDKPTN